MKRERTNGGKVSSHLKKNVFPLIRKRCAEIEIKMDIIGSKSFKKGYHGKHCICVPH